MAYEQSTPPAPGDNKKGGYGKRPLWQWILIYVVVGGIVYYGIYYFVFAGKGGYSSENQNYNYNYNSSTTNYNYNTNSADTNSAPINYNYNYNAGA